MRKGFTLIELLGTIVVISIISLITVPIITGIIDRVSQKNLKNSAYGVLEASDLYYAQYGVNKNTRFEIDNNDITSEDTDVLLNYKGSIKKGTVILNKQGKITLCITDGKNSAYKNYNDRKVTLVSKNKCYIPNNTTVVYLDNGGATVTELSNQELTDEIELLKEEIANLRSSKADKKDIISNNDIYPVGSIYLSMNNTNPSTLFGGTWVAIESGKMLQSTNTNSGIEGGQSSVTYKPSGTIGGTTLSIAQMPAHEHPIANNYGGATNHTGGQKHVLSFADYSTTYYLVGGYDGVVGGNQPHNHTFTGTQSNIATMPPYITVYMWKRTA